jgi:Skp family chaperone for outer membrane proteins
MTMRRFLLVATLLALIGMTSAVADDPLKAVSPREQPIAETSTQSISRTAIEIALEEELETLEAQRQVKKGYLKLAEIDVTDAKRSLDKTTGSEDILTAKQELETAKAQLEIKSGELKEVEVKIKHAKKRLANAKAFAPMKAHVKELEACGAMLGVVGFGGTPLLAGIAEIQQPATSSTAGSKIAVFNMAAVIKHYEKAKYELVQMNEEKKKLSADLINMRGELIRLQQLLQNEQNPAKKEELADRQRTLTRQIEDADRKISHQLNLKANAIIAVLYDEIKSVVEKVAEAKGYDIVFAYPDATSPEELNSTYVKEMKLKPPAAQPFVVAKHVDVTDDVIKELNTRYPPKKATVRREGD